MIVLWCWICIWKQKTQSLLLLPVDNKTCWIVTIGEIAMIYRVYRPSFILFMKNGNNKRLLYDIICSTSECITVRVIEGLYISLTTSPFVPHHHFLQTTSSALKGAIQLGIGYTVGNLSSKPERDVLMQDFYVVESIFFPRSLPQNTSTIHFWFT